MTSQATLEASLENQSQDLLCSNCKAAHLYWKGAELPLKVYKIQGHSMIEWASQVLAQMSRKEIGMYVGVIWALWTERNCKAHGKQTLDVPKAIETMIKLIQKAAVERRLTPTGVSKINCDASFRPTNNNSSFGVVLHDHKGRIQFGGSSPIGLSYTTLEEELQAILQSLRLARAEGYLAIQVASDSLEAINLINSCSSHLNWVGLLVHDTLLEARWFNSLTFTHEWSYIAFRKCRTSPVNSCQGLGSLLRKEIGVDSK
ncbi:uncharacterized protein [Euphorbia lathyris]|uniref:uncharacterized protein n=1 Tax=Euphorbia lathyris TaxID=212925 RepID=UPI0033143EA0